jgi:hypothetical protein
MILSVSRRTRWLRQVRKGRRYCCHYRAKLHQWKHDFIDKFSITILGCRISKSEPVTNVPYQNFKLFPVTKKVPSEYFWTLNLPQFYLIFNCCKNLIETLHLLSTQSFLSLKKICQPLTSKRNVSFVNYFDFWKIL